ncbi:50S ribosomal protein L6 [Marivirga sp. S37H4]|uniref:Large ribosomal subunit protein uL6 n=1 Tax=Marivirga aurantiaca TaxID=2802615 RepID=A0A934X1G0_9BACT|nr:50S ribosomal protein L6 [Marivirga aurantiaca]MBK6267228.1 50S ribosomal protein L6 [Marivirga aurantiaca]
MSRIGKSPINLPQGVTLEIAKDNLVTVKGSKGSLQQQVNPAIKMSVEDNVVSLERPTESKRHKAMHGLYRALLANMVEGVSEGYKRELELVGVGYKAVVQGNVLELNVGYSHSIFLGLPDEIKVTAETVKGQNPKITLESIDKQLIGQVAAKIKSLRSVEPYKGKGIRFVGEYIRRKAGKTAAK